MARVAMARGATNEELESLGREACRRRGCQSRPSWSADRHAPGQLRCHGLGGGTRWELHDFIPDFLLTPDG